MPEADLTEAHHIFMLPTEAQTPAVAFTIGPGQVIFALTEEEKESLALRGYFQRRFFWWDHLCPIMFAYGIEV